MIYSMTAFGRSSQQEAAGCSVTVEIRTLNGRNLDIVLRLPKNYLELEKGLRRQISQSIHRGRTEVYVQIEDTQNDQRTPQINPTQARWYWEQLQSLHRLLPGSEPPKLEHLLSVPYLFETSTAAPDLETVAELITSALTEALDKVSEMRRQEGEALLEDCLTRLATLRTDLAVINSRKELVVEECQVRLRERLQELLKDLEVDENRLLQEVAHLADRADINEELVRLESHLDQMHTLLTGDAVAEGRQLDFLTQEMHRETNTIGCKTGDLETTQAVLRMKGEIGKLKEQVQNVE